MGGEKQLFLNGVDISAKALNGQAVMRNVPERDFLDTVKRGSDTVIERLQHENHLLKDCLMLFQNELKTAME